MSEVVEVRSRALDICGTAECLQMQDEICDSSAAHGADERLVQLDPQIVRLNVCATTVSDAKETFACVDEASDNGKSSLIIRLAKHRAGHHMDYSSPGRVAGPIPDYVSAGLFQ